VAIIFPISEFIAGGLFKAVLSLPILGGFVLKSVGETLSVTQSIIVTICLLTLIYVVLYNLESRSRSWPKRIAHARGVRVSARILNTKVIVYEGPKGDRTPVVRFDFEIEHEGKTAKASTFEYGIANQFDASKYPPGLKVSAKYDPSTGSMTMIDKNGLIVGYV
jgi:hypothetical protein